MGFLRWVLFRSGLLARIAQRQRRSVILMFHAVPREGAEEFHDLLQWLSKHFAVVSIETIVNGICHNRSEKSTVIALTFDDGLRNHHSVVYPALLDLRLPATFYVCPGLFNTAVTTWTWEVWCRIPWLPEPYRRELLHRAGIGDLSNGIALLEWMKAAPLSEREQVEDDIRIRTPEFVFTAAERELYELMNWKEVEDLDPSLINIGSHTMTHCDLPALQPEERVREIQGSRALLERRLGRPARDFCYPDGKHNDVTARAVAAVYRSAVTTVCGSIGPTDSPYALKRIGASVDLQWVSWLMAIHTRPFHRC